MDWNTYSEAGMGETWEEEQDREWFKDYTPPAMPTPKPAPAAPKAGAKPPEPRQSSVLATNEALVFALRVAPNVLYSRFKEFGQLGVLGWCDEFRELIDGIIQTGFDGALFTSTRETALQTCSQLLRLNLDVKMQIIVIYLSSQVARLRRFLDGDLQYEDYPDLAFPRP